MGQDICIRKDLDCLRTGSDDMGNIYGKSLHGIKNRTF